MPQSDARISVIIPAHNEAGSLPRLLTALVADGVPPCFEVLVIANGCVDRTADVARGFHGVTVIVITEASKWAALAEGNRVATFEARAYVDADVVISQRDLLTLHVAVQRGPWLAVAPERDLVRDRVAPVVGWYYDVWERLPQVRSGIFGRGVVVVSGAGYQRISSLPRVMSDDLQLSEAFGAHERTVVGDARVQIRLPRSVKDLVRRRIRVSTGNAEMDHLNLRRQESKTSASDLVRVIWESPLMLPKVAVFVGIAVLARIQASSRVRSRDFTTWLRDESSRQD